MSRVTLGLEIDRKDSGVTGCAGRNQGRAEKMGFRDEAEAAVVGCSKVWRWRRGGFSAG